MNLLRIDSSSRENSVSRQMTARFVEAWKRENPQGEVTHRDLAATSLPPVTTEWSRAAFEKAERRTELQRSVLALSDTLIDELIAADTIVIGSPMYNFTISAQLKAWIDLIVRPGRTIAYGPSGQYGLLTNKTVMVLISRGGAYSAGSPKAARDFQEPYLRQILAYVGITHVLFIHAENQQFADRAQSSREAALSRIAEFVAAAGAPAVTPVV